MLLNLRLSNLAFTAAANGNGNADVILSNQSVVSNNSTFAAGRNEQSSKRDRW
ncbi:hypothetical protein H6F86_17700 [Phormidium sp. FACHB-592]|uniref:Uncharacterized protein n=1 Tax=Stenomitos frigidus AS-A4 TaxID=2933935 RepID=A0ABV0KIZ7_9CYAN|nr:hypothetical protein [Phormidium sp. FACHB-592]MBD2075690.1 hypothetical protein [Phormidium sp. FACHB-592]